MNNDLDISNKLCVITGGSGVLGGNYSKVFVRT